MYKKYNYRLFGRSKGRGKCNQISIEAEKIRLTKIDSNKYNIIDIGPGYGESTIEIAKYDKERVIIACEKYLDGINKIAENSVDECLSNINIFHGNVLQLLDEYCTNKIISEMWILFPDPWPKKKHFKRRLLNIFFFNKIKNLLKKNAIIHIATDSKSYLSQILGTVYDVQNEYLWLNQKKQEWDYGNLALPKTKYFQKALKNGLNPFYLKLLKL